MKEEAKKAREQAYLQRFRENFVDFPDGEVGPSEHPDFLIKARPQCIGIEITEYHVPEPGEDRGSPTRAKEGTEDKVLRRASEQHQSRGLPPLVVHVLWHPHQVLNRRRKQELAADLANLVRGHLPETGHSVTIRHPHLASRSFPREVASLTVVRRKSISKNSWTSVRGAFVPTLTPLELQQLIRKKEAKVPSYRQQCREVWLLIVARGFEPSTHVDLGPEVEAYAFETAFDRAFFLHHANEYVAELHVRRAT